MKTEYFDLNGNKLNEKPDEWEYIIVFYDETNIICLFSHVVKWYQFTMKRRVLKVANRIINNFIFSYGVERIKGVRIHKPFN